MGYFQIIILLFFILIAIHFLNVVISFRKKMRLEMKRKEYERILEQACSSRQRFIKALENLDEFKYQIDHLEKELNEKKIKLRRIRKDLRKHLHDLRILANQKNANELESKIITLRKVQFEQLWKVFDSIKKSFNQGLDKLGRLHNQLKAQQQEEKELCEQWNNDKDSVLQIYNKLSSKIKITDPRVALSSY